MPRVAHKLCQRGICAVAMDLRGCGAGKQLARKPCNAGCSEDLAAALEFLVDLCPGSPVTAVGFSMGGNIVLKLAGETAGCRSGGLDSAIAICPPIDLVHCSKNFQRWRNRHYELNFVSLLLKRVAHFEKPELSPPPKRLWDFDDRFTAPMSGYRDAADYYQQASAKPVLTHVEVPTLLIAAENDPMIPYEIFRDAKLSSSIELHATRSGGHMGYIGVSGIDPDRRWMDWRIVDWAAAQSMPQTRSPELKRENKLAAV